MGSAAAREKIRWLLRWWAVQAALLFFAIPALPYLAYESKFDGDDYANALSEPGYFLAWVVATASITFLQWLFLLPVRPPARAKRKVRLVWSMVVGGLLTSLLLGGLVLASFYSLVQVAGVQPQGDPGDVIGWAVLVLLVANWAVATPLLVSFSDRSASPERYLRRLSAILFAGSAVEVLACIPLDVLASRRDSCWCFRGTYLTIVVGLTVGTVLLGPYVFLVLLARRCRRWPEGRCAACGRSVGDDLRILRCPHCGAGFRDVAGVSRAPD